MPSLSQLLATYDSALLLDASSARIQVGSLVRNMPARWESSAEEAGIGIFRCVEALNIDLAEASCFVFCEGPGSILGIRTTAMALRTWNVLAPRPTFAFSSLALVAHALGRTDVTVIADARRETWHRFQLGAGLARVDASQLTGELVMPENFRHWSALPPGAHTVPYELADLLSRASNADLFHSTDAPDAFLHEEPSYVTWTPQIHRAPTGS